MNVVVCPSDYLFRIRHFPLSYQKSCLLMGSQWVSSQELPWAEEILKPSPQRCPCWLPEYIEGLVSSSFASFWHGSEGLSLLQISPLEDLAGLRCRGIELPTLPNPAYFMASLSCESTVSLSKISNSASRVARTTKSTNIKYKSKSYKWDWLHAS